tara:strand:- start:271 stop:1026 length:756 start_codon:yes stop_codon:yes gene_type:complete
MKLTFRGKSAIVTGACGGMGLEVSKNLSENNILVFMIDLKEPPKNFLKDNKNCIYKKIDVTNYKKLKTSTEKFYKKNKRIDYLINTTGVLWFDKDVSSTNIKPKIWDKVYEINLKSMVYLSKIIIPKMIKNKFGSMVHISSVDALSGDDKPQDAYGSSKAAMIRLSKSLAIQFASNSIRSNCILPGAVDTGMQKRWKKNPSAKKRLAKIVPLNRVGKPKDISNTIMFLLSDQSNYITGTEIIIDGGITAKP